MVSDKDPAPREVVELPPYTAILIVDVLDFSGRPGRDHARMTEAIPGILRQGFRRAGLADLWDDNKFEAGTGDGYVIGFRPAVLPFLLNPLLPALQEELAFRNKVATATEQTQPLRMRVTVHVGPMTSSGRNALSEGSGAARIEAHRLIDAQPVRDLLTRSSSTTCVAAIVSARVFQDVVEAGYSAEDPAVYIPAPVKVKSYEGTAYLRVPAPSGELLSHGFHAAEPETEVGAAEPAPRAEGGRRGTGDIHGDHNVALTDAQGPVHIGDRYAGGARRPRYKK